MASESGKMTTYADAGVDIDAGNALISRISPLIDSTNRSGVVSGIGGFGGLFDLKDAGYGDTMLVAATDGVGTKLKIAQIANKHNTIGIDLVAMCVNDLLAQAAEPLFFLDYYACGALSVDTAAQVVEGIALGCRQTGCALIGGETAEMPGMYQSEDYDLAGFTVGAVSRKHILPNKDVMKAGDVLIGLASDGIHSNGYSLVRKLVERKHLDYNVTAPWQDGSITVADSLLTPTRIYVRSCLPLMREKGHVKAFAHITGGGLTENMPRVLPEHLAASINLSSWDLPPVFAWMKQAGSLDEQEMLKTFNCGIGAVLVVAEDKAEHITNHLQQSGETVHVIGSLTDAEHDSQIVYRGSL